MAPDPGYLSKCIKCGARFEPNISSLNPCSSCGAAFSEATGAASDLISELREFCFSQCADPLLACLYISVQLDTVCTMFYFVAKEKGGAVVIGEVFEDAIERADIHNGPKCEKCQKYLLGHPVGSTICQSCRIERKEWNSQLGVTVFDT